MVVFFFSVPSHTQCLASHQVIEHPKKKKNVCRGKRHHLVMGHTPAHAHTHTRTHTKKKVSPTSIKNKSSRSSHNVYTIKKWEGRKHKTQKCFSPPSKTPPLCSSKSGRLAAPTTKSASFNRNTAASITSAARRDQKFHITRAFLLFYIHT